MADLNKVIRHKRFEIQPDAKLDFLIQTRRGSQMNLALENCSLTGLGANYDGAVAADEGFEIGEIIPNAKLSWSGHELALGRLVLRTVLNRPTGVYMGFSTVDTKIPVEGPLSRFLRDDLKAKGNAFEFELNPDKFSIANFTELNQTNVDLFGKCKQFKIYFKDWIKRPRYMYHTVREPSMGVRVKLSERRKGSRNDYIVMGSNDYLGLSSHPAVLEAAKKAIDQYGFGSTGSPLTTGISAVHEQLCELLARTFKKDKAVLFNSGYAANVGCMPGLTLEQDMIVADALSHASIQDGMQQAKATSRFFKHNDMAHLAKILEENRDSHSGALMVTEGVFSMDGDLPKLDEFVELARKYKARTYLDEAHSFGVVGENGLGAWEKFESGSKVDVIMGTFSKICGGIGGFVVANEEVADWIYWYARSHVFSVSIPPSTAAAALKALQIFLEQKELVHRLQDNIKHFTQGLRLLGYPMNPNHESAVIPVVIGDEDKLGKMNQVFKDDGVFVVPIVFPAVSRKSCRFRFTVTANHTISDLDYVLHVFERAMQVAGFNFNDKVETLHKEEKKSA